MLLLSYNKIVLSLFITLYSIFLVVNGASLTDEQSPNNTGSDGESEDASSSPEDKPAAQVDTDSPIIRTLDEIGDTFVILTISVLPELESQKPRIIIEYEIEINGTWFKGFTGSEKITLEKLSGKMIEGRGVLQYKVSPLETSSNYRFYVSGVYGTKKYPENPEALEVKTKALAPKTTIAKGFSFLTFEGKDVKSFHVQISKVKTNNQDADCVFKASFTPCFSQELIMPELTSGEAYTIETWYIDLNEVESEHVINKYTA